MTIRFKLIAAFFCVTLIPIVIIALFTAKQALDREREQFNHGSVKQIREVDNAFNLFLTSVAQNVTLLSQASLVKAADSSVPSYKGVATATKMHAPSSGVAKEIYELFQQMGKSHPNYA